MDNQGVQKRFEEILDEWVSVWFNLDGTINRVTLDGDYTIEQLKKMMDLIKEVNGE